MTYPLYKKLTLAFWLLALLDIMAIITGSGLLQAIAKPLLIPCLILLLLISVTSVPGKISLLIALLFSWFGDILLLLESRNKLFFIFGLVCFLTTHIFYILYFLSIRSANSSLLKKQPLLILLVIGYGTGLVWLLFPHLGDLRLPVIIYAVVICSMLLCSLHIFLKVNSTSARFFLSGAVAFILSDSLLAIDKFYQPFAWAGAFIILTYCIAQYFIIKGFIKQYD